MPEQGARSKRSPVIVPGHSDVDFFGGECLQSNLGSFEYSTKIMWKSSPSIPPQVRIKGLAGEHPSVILKVGQWFHKLPNIFYFKPTCKQENSFEH